MQTSPNICGYCGFSDRHALQCKYRAEARIKKPIELSPGTLKLAHLGELTCVQNGTESISSPVMLVLAKAWNAGLDLEEFADGLGVLGTWAVVQNSTTPAIARMFQRALERMNFETR